MSEREIFTVRLRPTPDCKDAYKSLRALLKRALRDWGLRCVGLARSKEGEGSPQQMETTS
jgi:hypothetical protein